MPIWRVTLEDANGAVVGYVDVQADNALAAFAEARSREPRWFTGTCRQIG